MEHTQKLLDKSDDLLDAEMTRSQSLVEDIKNLHAKYQELESLHETLSTTYEKLSYDYLQRKQELEKLKAKSRGSSFISSSRINLVCQIFFSHPSGVCQELIYVSFHRRPSFQLSFSNYPGAYIKCSLISSYLFVLVHLIPSSIFVLLILPGDSFSFISHFRILTLVRSRFFSFIILLIHSFFPILPVVHEDLLKFAICHFSILFKKNK